MTPAHFNIVMRRELANYLRLGLISETSYDELKANYPVSRWDWHSLGKWFLIFGAISFMAGCSMLIRQYFGFTLERLAIGLLTVMTLLLFGAFVLKQKKMWVWTPRILELLAAFALIGLTFTLGIIFSTGSGNWPALLLIDLLIILPLAYLLNNVLLLILCSILFFTWFGGVTGYLSGWGAYWFGMNYPMRFFLVSLAMLAVAAIHWRFEKELLMRFKGFFKVWLSAAMFFAEMSLWLMSLFGNFGDISRWHIASGVEILFFNLLWVGLNVLALYLGSRWSLRMLRGYGSTFLMIQGYTLFFRYMTPVLGPIFAPLLAGGSLLWLVVHLEKQRHQKRAKA